MPHALEHQIGRAWEHVTPIAGELDKGRKATSEQARSGEKGSSISISSGFESTRRRHGSYIRLQHKKEFVDMRFLEATITSQRWRRALL
jgi:hypothetical protein